LKAPLKDSAFVGSPKIAIYLTLEEAKAAHEYLAYDATTKGQAAERARLVIGQAISAFEAIADLADPYPTCPSCHAAGSVLLRREDQRVAVRTCRECGWMAPRP
jgi:hypothetical protein